MRVIVPITGWKDNFSGAIWMVRIGPDTQNRLAKISAIDTFQIRSISTERFIKKTGLIPPDTLTEIITAVKAVIDAD